MNKPTDPIRVVVFTCGPVLQQDVKQFICQLEAHPEIAFLGAYCQSEAQAFRAVMQDLWRRRRFLALPVLLMQVVRAVGRHLSQPRAESQLNGTIARLSDRVHYVPDIHAEEVLEDIRSLKPDLGLIYGSPILKPKLFEIPGHGTFGIHHGKVPEYRGKKTTFWAIYNGEKTAGVTIQKVNAGLDTGEIVREGAVPVARRSLGTVWRELEALGLCLYIEAILEVKAGTATYRPQVGKKGKLYHDPGLGDILHLWVRQVRRRVMRSRSPKAI